MEAAVENGTLLKRSLAIAASAAVALANSAASSSSSSSSLHQEDYSSGGGGGGGGSYNSFIETPSPTSIADQNETTQMSNQNGSNQNGEQQLFSDWWDDYWSRQPFPSGYTQSSITMLACLISTIIVLIVVGNSLVCIAIFTEKSLKPTQNWFIASLAVSDMLLGLVVMPFSLARELMGFWIFGQLWCDIHEAVDVLLTTASINTLCLISLDRYWSITQAVSYLKKRTPRRGAAMIAFVWVFSAAVSLPPLFGWKKQSPNASPAAAATPDSDHLLSEAASQTSAQETGGGGGGGSLQFEGGEQRKRRKASVAYYSLAPIATDQNFLPPSKQTSHTEILNHRQNDKRQAINPLNLIQQAERNDKDQDGQEDNNDSDDSEQHASKRWLSQEEANAQVRGAKQASNHSQLHARHHNQRNDRNHYQHHHHYNHHQRPLAKRQDTDPDYSPFGSGSRGSSFPTPTTPFLSSASSESLLLLAGGANTPAPAATLQASYPTCQLSDDVGYVLYSALGSFFIPCAVMVFTYIKIFLAARSRARRTINKQSRAASGGASEKAKRLANRRTIAGAFKGHGVAAAAAKQTGRHHQQAISDSEAVAPTSGQSIRAAKMGTGTEGTFEEQGESAKQVVASPEANEPLTTRGKLVVVARRKSQSAPTRKTSDSVAPPSGRLRNLEADTDSQQQQKQATSEVDEERPCVITTSGAVRASPSALNGAASTSNESSSIITIMSGSMSELPVTRFNFKQNPSPERNNSNQSKERSAATVATPVVGGDEQKPSTTASGAAGEREKAAALLKAISQAAGQVAEVEEILKPTGGGVCGEPPLPNIVVERRATPCDTKNNNGEDRGGSRGEGREIIGVDTEESAQLQAADVASGASTNETCFMTIEEDSDNLEAQTGRTIMMIASNTKQSSNLAANRQNLVMTMMPANSPGASGTQVSSTGGGGGGGRIICNNVACLRRRQAQKRHPRSGSSYCGSSMTINDDDDEDADENDELEVDDDEEEEGEEEEEDEIDDDDDECPEDDELLTDDCNGYSGSCNLDLRDYCTATGNSSTCVNCRECAAECHQRQQQQQQQLHHRDSQTLLSASEIATESPHSPARKLSRQANHHDVHHQPAQPINRPAHPQKQKLRQQREQQAEPISDTQSLTGDENLSLTEYRSNEENSSIVGHDMLDATERTSSAEKKRRSATATTPAVATATGADNEFSGTSGRKKSSIGFRLGRLGSSAAAISGPLTSQSGGLLALAAQQQQQQQHNQSLSGGAIGTTRNLKALRQNFFHKLNQLTAKSAAKHDFKSSGRSAKSGKSSAQSSGSSFEPSVDYATTSNVHSINDHYHLETTFGETDDYEPQTSNETTNTRDQRTASMVGADIEQAGGSKGTVTGFQRAGHSAGHHQHHHHGRKQSKEIGNGRRNSPQARHKDSEQDIGRHLLSADEDSMLAVNSIDNGNINDSNNSGPGSTVLNSKHQSSQQRFDLGGDGDARKSSGGGGAGGGGLLNVIGKKKRSLGEGTRGSSVMSASTNVSANSGRHHHQGANVSQKTSGAGRTGANGGSSGPVSRAYLASDNERHKRKLAKARERRATLILGLIMAAFICSWMPFFTFYVIRALCHSCRDFISPRLEASIFWMGYCNSAINPIIYTIFNRDFRKAFRKILLNWTRCLF